MIDEIDIEQILRFWFFYSPNLLEVSVDTNKETTIDYNSS